MVLIKTPSPALCSPKPNVQIPDVLLDPSFVPSEDLQATPSGESVPDDVPSHACSHSECFPGLGGETICVWDDVITNVATPSNPSLVVAVSGPFNTKASEVIRWDSRGESVPDPTSHSPPAHPCEDNISAN